MNTTEFVFVDLSSIAVPIWKSSTGQADPDWTCNEIVRRVRELCQGHAHAAICCDSGKSFRNELEPSYKAQRPESDAPMHHQIAVAKDRLAGDGFPVWSVRGFEADDLLASGVALALAMSPETTALVISGDKDLFQLVGPRVRVMSSRSGTIYDAAGVKEKYGVTPEQFRDYLTLVGDSSDNVKGADKIGAKWSAKLLTTWESIDKIYAALNVSGNSSFFGLPPGIASSLREFWGRLEGVRALITLRADVDLPFDEITIERTAKELEQVEALDNFTGEDMEAVAEPVAAPVVEAVAEVVPVEKPAVVVEAPKQTALAVRQPVIEVLPVQYERQLDPRSLKDAETLSTYMHQAKLFSSYGNAPAILSTIILGRELGMPAMASLRGIHIVEGRHTLSAQTMVALVLKSGLAEYFEAVEVGPTSVTYETKRVGARNPMTMTHTIEMAQIAGLVKEKSNWVKVPTDMLVARCSSRLARLVYPDLTGGLYTPEELREVAEDRKVA